MRKKNLQNVVNEIANFEIGIYNTSMQQELSYLLGAIQSLLDEVASAYDGNLYRYESIECESLEAYVEKSKDNLRAIRSAAYSLENNMLDSTYDQYAFMLEILNCLNSMIHQISVNIDETNRILNDVSIDD